MSLAKRPKLSLESLDERIVPAVLDLTTVTGASSALLANGAYLHRTDSPDWTSAHGSDAETTGTLRKFVRMNAAGVEQGMNTDARPLQFNELDVAATRAIKLKQVPVVMVDGVAYREFVLNVNQVKKNPFLSLDEVRVFTGTSATLTGYNAGSLPGAKLIYNLDSAGDQTIKLEALRNDDNTPVPGEMTLLIPQSAFDNRNAKDGNYVYLYSKMGGTFAANGATEAWGFRKEKAAPDVPASLSGSIFLDHLEEDSEGHMVGNGILDGQDTPLNQSVTLTLFGFDPDGNPLVLDQDGDGNGDYTITTTDGTFNFTNLPVGTYFLSVTISESETLATYPGTGDNNQDGNGGVGFTSIDDIMLSSGENGVNYNFLMGHSGQS